MVANMLETHQTSAQGQDQCEVVSIVTGRKPNNPKPDSSVAIRWCKFAGTRTFNVSFAFSILAAYKPTSRFALSVVQVNYQVK